MEKTRYPVEHEGVRLELDVYHGALGGLIVLEAEFPNEDIASSYQLPSWIGPATEVTADKRFKNKALAWKIHEELAGADQAVEIV